MLFPSNSADGGLGNEPDPYRTFGNSGRIADTKNPTLVVIGILLMLAAFVIPTIVFSSLAFGLGGAVIIAGQQERPVVDGAGAGFPRRKYSWWILITGVTCTASAFMFQVVLNLILQ